MKCTMRASQQHKQQLCEPRLITTYTATRARKDVAPSGKTAGEPLNCAVAGTQEMTHTMKRRTTASRQHMERRWERRWEPRIPSVLPCSCSFCSVVRSVGKSAVKIQFPIFVSLRVPGLRTLVGNQSRRHCRTCGGCWW